MESQLPEWFWADRLTLVRFYGYPSSTKDRVFELDFYTSRTSPYIERINTFKIKAQTIPVNVAREGEASNWQPVWDNKVVIECLTEDGKTIYVGFYDSFFSIGTDLRIGGGTYEYKRVNAAQELEGT